MTDPTHGYVADVAHHLRARGAVRRQALADLEAALREAGPGAGEDFGPAEAYAAAVDAELGTGRPFRTLLGIPNSLAPGMLARMAATFDPADGRIVVPHVLGIGWAINAGAVAVRLGLLNPDDLDDELLADAVDGPGRAVRVGAWLVVGAAALATAYATGRRRRSGLPARKIGEEAAGAALVVGLSAGLAALGGRPDTPPGQRLVAPAYATLFAAAVAADGFALGRDGVAPRVAGLWGLAVGTAAWVAGTYGPVRATVRRQVTTS